MKLRSLLLALCAFVAPVALRAIVGPTTDLAGNALSNIPFSDTTSSNATYILLPPLPTVSGVSPTSGSSAGGTSVTVTGTNFVGTPTVSFGGSAGTNVSVTDSSHLTVNSPAGTNTVDVLVTNASGASTGTAADQFTYISAPTISSVSAPSDATYYFSQNLDFTVNYSAAVTVTGTPSISVTIGSTVRTATYVSGGGTTALLFRYTVQPGELDTDGIAVASPLVLNGGTIVATSNSTAAGLTFTPPTTTGVLVSNLAPSLNLITRANGTSTASSSLSTILPQGALSVDGRYLVFKSFSSDLVGTLTTDNFSEDIFLSDLVVGTTKLVSHTSGSTTAEGSGASTGQAISPNGNWVVYYSAASDLVTGQTGATGNIFLWNRVTDTTYLVSSTTTNLTGDGTVDAASGTTSSVLLPVATVTSDASYVYVLYRSSALDGAANLYQVKFDLTNLSNRTRTLVSHTSGSATVAAGVVSINDPSLAGAPSMSGNGRYVAFVSAGTNLVAGQTDANGQPDVFIWDRDTAAPGNISLISHLSTSATTTVTTSNGSNSGRPMVSGNGSYVVWTTKAPTGVIDNLVDSSANDDAYLYEVATGTNILVSRRAGSAVTAGGATHLVAGQPFISSDGRYVTLLAQATGASGFFGSGLTNSSVVQTLYLFDRVAAAANPTNYALRPLSYNAGTTTASNMSAINPMPVTSTNAAVTVYANPSATADLGNTDGNGAGVDASLVLPTGVTARTVTLSALTAATTGNGTSNQYAVNSTGNVIVVQSGATNLVAGLTDLNGTSDLFLYRHAPGTVDAVFSYTPPANGTITAASVTGSLPAGLTIDGSTGVISGTPTTAGSSSVIVTLTVSGNTVSWPLALTIGKATLTVNLAGLAPTYDTTAKSVTASTTGPSLSASAFAITYNGSSSAPTAAGTYPIVATINHADYQGVGYGSLVIAQAPVTITGLAASNKVYDRGTTASLTGTPALSGVAGSDSANVTLSGTASAAFADKIVANTKAVTVTGYTLSGTAAANYSLTQPSFTANITAAPLTVTGFTASNRPYDRGTTATVQTGSAVLSGVIGADGVILSSGGVTGSFADKLVATAKTVTAAGFSISGADAANYSLTQPTTTANITSVALTVSGITASDKIYDGTTSVTLTGTASLNNVISGDTVNVSAGTGTFGTGGVGVSKTVTATGFTLGGGDAANYSLTQPSGLTATITAKALTVTGLTAVATRTYDGTTVAGLTGTAAIQLTEAAGIGTTSDGKPYSVDAVTISGAAAGAFASKDVGTAKAITISGLTVSGTGSTNYTVTQPAGLTANVTAKALTVSGVAATSTRIYDGTTVAGLTGTAAFTAAETTGTGTTSDGIPYTVDSVTVGSTAVGAFVNRNVGTAKAVTVTGLTVSGTGSSNYTATQPTGLTADITAKALSIAGVTAVATRVYDGTTVAGLSGTAAFLSTEAAGAGTTSDGKPYSVDTINVGGTAAGAFADRNVGTAKAITVSGITVAGIDAANYTATQPTGLSADVTAKALTVASLSAVASRTYDGTTVAGLTGTAAFLSTEAAGAGTTVDGKPYSVDTISVTGTAAASFANRNVGTAKAITITGLSVGSTDSGNYTAVQPTGLSGNVTAKALTIAGLAASDKIYDATVTAALTGTAAFLSNEAAGAGTTVDGKPYSVDTINVGGTAAGTFVDKDVAAGKAVTVTGLTVAGTDAANYSATQPTSLTAAVSVKTLTVSGVTASNKVYDGVTAATLSGSPTLQSAEAPGAGTTADGKPYTGDTFSAAGTLTGTFADKNVGTAKTVSVAGVTLSGAQSGNYVVAALTTTADITPKALNISGVIAVTTRTYDGTTVAGLTGTAAFTAAETTGIGTTSDGIPYSVDSVTVGGTAAGAFGNRNVGTAKAITVTGLTVTGTGAANYTATQPTGLTADVTTKALSIAGVTAVATRVYDGTTVAGLSGTAAFLSTEAAGAGTTSDGKPYSVDTINVGGTAAGAFADRNVGTTKAITVSGITVAGIDAANYTATQPTGLSADVTAKALTVASLSAVASRTYDGTTVAGLTGTAAFLSTEAAGAGTTVDGKPYSVDTISVTGTAAASFANRNVGTAKAITITGLSVGSTDAANYTAVQPTGLSGNVTAKALTVAGLIASDKIYDATVTAALTGTAAFLSNEAAGAGTTVDGKPYSVDTINVGGTAAGTFADKDVATGKAVTVTGLTVAGIDAANYSATQPAGLTATITKKTLTVSGVTASNKVYDGVTAATLSGSPTLQSAEAPGAGTTADGKPYTGDTFSAAGTLTGTFADKNVATAKTVSVAGVTLSGAQSGNYVVAALTTTADITPKALNISGVIATATRTYDGTTVAGLTGTAAFTAAETTGTGTTSDGIPYSVDSVTVGGTSAGAFADRNVGTAKAITVTGLTVTGTGSSNYTATQPTGLVSDITAKALTVAGLSAVPTRVYDTTVTAGLTGTAAFLTAEAAGTGTTVDGTPYTVDTITINGTAAGTFAAKTVGTAKAITVTGVTVTGADNANYTVTQPTGLTANVTTAGLTVSGVTANNRVYDAGIVANLNLGTAALVGVLSGDTVTIGTGTAAGTFASKTIGTAKPVTITGITISGTDSGNYALTQPATTANITAKTIIVTGVTASDKQYDALLTATPVYTSAALVGVSLGDTVTFVSSGGSATFATKAVATGKVVTFTGLTLGGADGGNYILTQPTTTATITPKNLTVAGVTANSKTYDGNTTASLNLGTAAPVGVISGDTVTVNTAGGTGTFANASAGLNKLVQVAGLALAGTDAANYTVTQPTTTANISPAGVSISITNLNFTYDGTPKSATVTISPGAAASIVYSGGGSPVNAGSYTVSVNITDNNYSGSSTATLTIAKANQTVAFSIDPGANFNVGSTHALTASATSTLPITFSIISGSASLSGSSVTVTQAGAATIRASQAGDGNFNAASADQGFTGLTGTKTAQTINFGALSDVTTDLGSFTVSATASSGLPVSFTIINGPGVLSGGNRVTLTGATGLMTIRASQAGNATFSAAPDVVRSFIVSSSSPDTFFGDLTDDSGITGGQSGRGELVQGSGPRVDAKTGDVAAVLYPGTRRGSLIIVAPSFSLNVSLDFTLNADGTYTVPFTSGGRSLTVTGSLTGTTIVGHIPTLNVSFITTILAHTGITKDIAGFYESDSLNSATGGTASIVGPNGQLLIVASTGSLSTGALGSVSADGKFNVNAPGATITGIVDAPTTTVTGTITIPGQSPVSFSGLSATTARTDRLINLSSRVQVGPTPGRTLITGFVIGGGAPKRVLLRATGPALTGFGVQGALTNPRLQLYDGTGKLLLENDDWSGAEISGTSAQVGAFTLVAGSKDAAIITTLEPGAYTMQVMDGGETGVALAEIYDASLNPQGEYQRLINISTRGQAGAGENVLIGGFIITGNSPKRVLVRGIGPGLAAFGVGSTLADPRLRVYNATGLVAENDNWSTVAADATAVAQAATDTGAFVLASGSKDAAMILTLAPGAYTAQVGATDGTSTGVALVEIYELPQ